MTPFTRDEIRRIHGTLSARFLKGAYPGVRAIGFGPGLKQGVRDADRPFTVCFFVGNKRTPRDRSQRLPQEILVKLKRGARFETVRFRTDVVEQRAFKPTAHHVVEDGEIEPLGSVGAVIRWPSGGNTQWGLLTVGHFLRDVGAITDDGPVLSVRLDPLGIGLSGQLVARSTATETVDAAVLTVDPADLLAFNILDPAGAFPQAIASVDGMSAALDGAHLAGMTLPPIPPGGTPGFLTMHFLVSTGTLIEGMPALANAIRVESAVSAFEPGTSGSAWLVQGESAALQVAGLPEEFLQGIGQMLETQLEWVRDKLELPDLPELMGVF